MLIEKSVAKGHLFSSKDDYDYDYDDDNDRMPEINSKFIAKSTE